MDLVVRAARLPARGETLVGDWFDPGPGGKGANQAAAVGRLGADTALIGAVGRDEFGETLQHELVESGVELCLDLRDDAATGVAVITSARDGDNTIVVAPGANHALTPAFVLDHGERIAAADWLVTQLEVPLEAVAAGIAHARANGTAVLLNAAPARDLPPDLLRSVDVLVVNHGEAATVAAAAPSTDAAELARALCARGPGLVVVTRGVHGAIAFDGHELWSHASFPVDAVDTVGAGDAFVGALTIALGLGRPIARALRWASAGGALACTARGAMRALPWRDELAGFLSRHK
jgi:ribokinase